MTVPLVSVVVPARNAAETINSALGSVLRQSHRDLEVIVVDDASTDATARAVAAFGPRVRLVGGEGRGAGPARNTGLRSATGELIAFLDADDLWRPQKILRQVAALAAMPGAAWSYTDAFLFAGDPELPLYRVSDRHVLPGGNVASRLALGNFIVTSSVIVARAALEAVGGFPARPHAEDWALWLRLAARYPAACVAEPLTGYRVHPQHAAAASDPLADHRDRVAALEDAIAFAPGTYAALRRSALARVHLKTGIALVARDRLREARLSWWRAWRLDPACAAAALRLAASLLGARFVRALLGHRRAAVGLPELN